MGAPTGTELEPRRLNRAVPALLIALLGFANVLAVPAYQNQNQYLAHALGERVPQLQADWLVTTVDPYPLFTWLGGLLIDAGGDFALRAAACLVTVVALTGGYLIARALNPGRTVAAIAIVMLGATLIPWTTAPIPLGELSAFHGFVGQYLINKPGYLQPSSAGVLLLVALGLWLGAQNGRRNSAAAAGLVVVACAVHPAYLVVTGIGLGAALLADLVAGSGWRRLPGYLIVGAASAAVAVLANPAVFSIAGGEARDRFAFERIPHHTLLSSWRWYDVAYLVLITAAAILVRPLRHGRWLSVWLIAATVPGLLAAFVVEFTRWAGLALPFPWRISVVAVPVAATVVAVRLGRVLTRLPVRDWTVLACAAAIGGYGLHTSMQVEPPEVADPATALVLAAHPQGVGLVPLAAQNVRLNAEVPIYVDWKSPPYAGPDLQEWWRRYDQVAGFEQDPQSFCGADWSTGIDWVLLPVAVQVPCLQEWDALGESDGYVVRQRPAAS